MLLYCLKCKRKKKQKVKTPQLQRKIKENEWFCQSVHCGMNINGDKLSNYGLLIWLLSNLGLKTTLSKTPTIGDILF